MTGEQPLRVGLLTSWQTPCGVYDYSRHLADALARRDDVEVVILASDNDPGRQLSDPETHTVKDVARIGHWRGDHEYSINLSEVRATGLDVLHVQYQSMLFEQEALRSLGYLNAEDGVLSVITFHDNCVRGDFPVGLFPVRITHRGGVGPADHIVPFGVENYAPLVRTFGLGRTREDVIRPICEKHGFRFESAASSEAASGGQAWRSQEDLHAWLREADAIVLWYGETAMAGSSQAARTAMATRRPLFINDTTWFREIPDGLPGVFKMPDAPEELEYALVSVLSRPFISDHSWDRVAELHVRLYRRGLGA